MNVAVYWGCKIPTQQYAYEMSVRQVLPRLNIELVDLKGTSCCGGPIRSVNSSASTYLSARNLALTNLAGLTDVLVPCNECHFMLTETQHRIERDQETRSRIDASLHEEGLKYPPRVKIWHIIDLLHDQVKVDTIKSRVKRPLKGLKFAVHPGCQVIRPSEIGRPDCPENPRKLDALVAALGAEVSDYAEKLDCCGAALLYSHEDAALSLAGAKLKAVQTRDVDGLVDVCPYCHIMYDARQKDAAATVGGQLSVPVVYYTQLLGLALGIDQTQLGLHLNRSFVPEKFGLQSG